MLSLFAIHRICAAIDAVTFNVIAAGVSKTRAKPNLAAFTCESNHPENFLTIAACKPAAGLGRSRSDRKPQPEAEAPDSRTPVGAPALVKLKAETDPEKLFHLFRSNGHNRLVVENRFAFEDTVFIFLFRESWNGGSRREDLPGNAPLRMPTNCEIFQCNPEGLVSKTEFRQCQDLL